MNKRLVIKDKVVREIREDLIGSERAREKFGVTQLDVLRLRSWRRFRRGSRNEIIWRN